MVGVSRLLVALAVAGLLSEPLYADIIPTRRVAESTDSSKKVEGRLLQMGLTAEAAKQQVQQLTNDQANYFASNFNRIQLVGQENWGGQSDNFWWEWIFGIGALAAAGAIIAIAVHNDPKA